MIEIKGSRWYKADLHLHTPASECFTDKTVTPEQWVQACIDKGLDCIAVTDHNTGYKIDDIKEASKDKGLVVFPGVEVTCSDAKVHILVLFDTDKGTEDVNSFLSRLELVPSQFGKQDTKVRKTVMQVVEAANSMGAIVIPAHIDQFSGLGKLDYLSREDLFTTGMIQGFQAVHEFFTEPMSLNNDELKLKLDELYGEGVVSTEESSEWQRVLSHALEKDVPILTFSDNPESERSSKHGINGIGQRYTWIKMDEIVTLESLRQALLMYKHRIINDFDSSTTPKTMPDFWINKIEITDTILNPGSSSVIHFNPQMTAIIGGRGTGKSSITRFIRGCFNLNKELEDHKELLEEQKRFYKVKNTNVTDVDSVGILKSTTVIKINVVRHDDIFCIVADNFQGESQKITLSKWNFELEEFEKIDDEEGQSLISLFNLEIYSQKQIYEIAKNPNALRDKVDGAIEEMKEVKFERNLLKRKYLNLSNEIMAKVSEVGEKSIISAEIKDKEAQLKKIEDNNYNEILETNKMFMLEARQFNTMLENLTKDQQKIKDITDKLKENATLDLSFNEKHKNEVNDLTGLYNFSYNSILSNLNDVDNQFEKMKTQMIESINETLWKTEYELHKEKYDKLKDNLSVEDIKALGNLEKINIELTNKKDIIKNLERIEKEIPDLIEEKNNIYTEYMNLRHKIRELRITFIDGVLKDHPNIKIDVKRFRDKPSFESGFRRIIDRETFKEEVNKIMDFCFRGNVEQKVPQLIQRIESVRNGSEDDLIKGRFLNRIKELKEAQIDELKLLMPEDDIQVSYKNNDGVYQSLSNASAGQKTSAILTFLLSYGETPLILDQPEDDLDNYLIYELIVERLRATKSKRQIIVVTHNANIPVNGDAELVVVMDSQSTNIQPSYVGNIESNNIKTNICEIMEGGEAAFKLRAKRYNISNE